MYLRRDKEVTRKREGSFSTKTQSRLTSVKRVVLARFASSRHPQEATVKLGARGIATLAVTSFLLVPAIFADDTGKPADTPKHDESMNSTAMPGAAAAPKPAGPNLVVTREASSEP